MAGNRPQKRVGLWVSRLCIVGGLIYTMGEWLDYYMVLQVHQNAEPDVVESAYKKLCMKYHPDRNPTPEAQQKIRQINAAYEVLKDEKLRGEYFNEWQRYNQVFYKRNIRNEKPVWGDESAKKVITQYFFCLSNGLYEDAYATLCSADKKNIKYPHFAQWQRSVSEIYKIHNFHVVESKRFDSFLMEDYEACTAERYTVKLHEENLVNRTEVQYSLYKFAVYESGQWRIYLGYRDVLALSLELRKNANNGASKNNFSAASSGHMGILSSDMFVCRAELEVERHKRYYNPFVIGAVGIIAPQMSTDILKKQQLISFTELTLHRKLRNLDALSHLGNGQFAILLAETRLGDAKRVCERLERGIQQEGYATFNIKLRLKFKLVEYSKGTVNELIEACRGKV